MKTHEELIATMGEMTVVEMLELVKRLEQTWGVSAAQAMPMIDPHTSTRVEPEAPTHADVVLRGVGGERIPVIRELRELLGLSLSECRDRVVGVPSTLAAGLEIEEAEAMAERLRELGAAVDVDPVTWEGR